MQRKSCQASHLMVEPLCRVLKMIHLKNMENITIVSKWAAKGVVVSAKEPASKSEKTSHRVTGWKLISGISSYAEAENAASAPSAKIQKFVGSQPVIRNVCPKRANFFLIINHRGLERHFSKISKYFVENQCLLTKKPKTLILY